MKPIFAFVGAFIGRLGRPSTSRAPYTQPMSLRDADHKDRKARLVARGELRKSREQLVSTSQDAGPAQAESSPRATRARRSRIYRGVQSAVARRLGRSRAHVSLVARGLRSSKAVLQALAAEVERVERAAKEAA